MLDLIDNQEIQDNFEESTIFYNYPCSFDDLLEIPFEDLLITSITDYKFLFQLIEKSINSSEFTWKDVAQKLGIIRNVGWLGCVISPQNLIEWRSCLENLNTIRYFSYGYDYDYDYDAQTHLAAFIIGINMYKCLNKKTFQLQDIIAIFNNIFPEYKYLVPLYLILMLTDERISIDQNNLSIVLPILLEYDINDINSDWLKGTYEWRIFGAKEEFTVDEYFFEDGFVIDTLATCLKNLENISNQGLIEKDEHYQDATRFVQNLLERREREKRASQFCTLAVLKGGETLALSLLWVMFLQKRDAPREKADYLRIFNIKGK